jgi:hypothetical protein
MQLSNILNAQNNFFWTLFHIALGFLSTLSPFVFVAWFYIFFLVNVGSSFLALRNNNYANFLSFVFYLVSFELLGRMSQAAPFVPSELGKYFLFGFSLLTFLIRGVKSRQAMLITLLFCVALFIDLSGRRSIVDIIFNWFGIGSAALGIAVFYGVKIQRNQLDQLLKLIWLTSLSALIYTYIRTPELEDIEFTLKAQFATTANTSSNQVSTILGLGMFLSFYSIVQKIKFSGYRILDILILVLFTFQGLLSFSRGGMIVGALAIMAFYLLNKEGEKVNYSKLFFGLIGTVILLTVVFKVTDTITDGKLALRYQGETEGSLRGSKEVTTDLFLSGRQSIFLEDLNVWYESPLIGVGAGASMYMRKDTKYVAPHVELSRVMSEHGIIGIFAFLLLNLMFFKIYTTEQNKSNKGIFVALFILASFTTFHAAMRTYVSPMFYILAVLHVKSNLQTNHETTLHRRNQYRALT